MVSMPIAESVSELCDDLISEILLKLPLKTLVRFKQVSRTWFKIITSHHFTSKQFYNSIDSGNKNASFIVLRNQQHSLEAFITEMSFLPSQLQCKRIDESICPYYTLTYQYRPPPNYYPMIFYAGFGLYCIYEAMAKRVALWNPCTMEIKEMPISPFYKEEKKDILDNYMYGFGHAEYKDGRFSYKIGLLSNRYEEDNDQPRFVVELYNSSTHIWKVLTCGQNNIDCKYPSSWSCDGVNLNEKLHLLLTDLRSDPYIMIFDYGSEIFGRMEVPVLPQTGRYYWDRSLITTSDGKFLCLVLFWRREEIDWFAFLEAPLEGDFDNDNAINEDEIVEEGEAMEDGGVLLEVWVMGEYGVDGSWYKECTAGPITGLFADVMQIMNYSKSLGGIFLQGFNGDSLHFCKCGSSEVVDIDINSNGRTDIQFLELVKSLVSVDGTLDESHAF